MTGTHAIMHSGSILLLLELGIELSFSLEVFSIFSSEELFFTDTLTFDVLEDLRGGTDNCLLFTEHSCGDGLSCTACAGRLVLRFNPFLFNVEGRQMPLEGRTG